MRNVAEYFNPDSNTTEEKIRVLLLLGMKPRDEEKRFRLLATIGETALNRVFHADNLVTGDSARFCATGISDGALLPGVKVTGKKTSTHSILMRSRSRTVRFIRAVHDLEIKTIHLRGTNKEHQV